MASNFTKVPLIRATAVRGYAAGKASPVSGISSYEIKNTVLPNKLAVASADNESPISRVSIVFRAGSRNETSDNLGVSHVLRICAGLSTKNASQFAIIRNIQEVGASLRATADREVIAYTLEGTRCAIERCLPFLTEVATQQKFNPWEVSDNVPRLRLELATRPPQLRAVDLLHKAAYRATGLGNSLFTAKYRLGKISSETLQHYVAKNFTANRTAVVGLGVDHSDLVDYAQNLSVPNSETSSPKSPYKGGEIRSDKGGDLAFVAIAGEGAALTKPSEALAFAILQRALGVGPQVKWGWTDNAVLSKKIGGSVTEQYAISALNASYSDSGLFGVLIAAPSSSAGKLVSSAVDVIKSANVSDEDVARGKNQLKTAVLLAAESGSSAIEDIGVQAAVVNNALSASQIAAAIDGISSSDVNAAFKKCSTSKLSIASVGNLKTVPFLEELK